MAFSFERVLASSLEALGHDVERREPTVTSDGLDRACPTGRVTSRVPFSHIVCASSLVPGSGPRSREQHDAGSGNRAQRAEHACCGSAARRPRPDSLAPSLEDRRPRLARSSSRAAMRVPLLDISSSDIRVLAQWTAPAPMPNSASARPRPSASSRADVPDRERRSLVDREREVRDDEADGGEHRDREEQATCARPAWRPVGRCPAMRCWCAGGRGRSNGSGSRLRAPAPASVLVRGRSLCRAHAAPLGYVMTSLAFASPTSLATQTATADQRAQTEDPGQQALAHRAEARRGRGRPGSAAPLLRVEERDDVLLVLRRDVASLNTGIDCGPVSMAS